MVPKLLSVLILLQIYAVIAGPLASSEDEDTTPSNQSPMKAPVTSGFLRLFSETIAAVPVAVWFAENSENALMGLTSRDGHQIEDKSKGFQIFETADGSYEGIGPFIEFSSELDNNSDEYIPKLGLSPMGDDSYNSWRMRSKSSDPVIISEIVFDASQEELSDESENFSSELWVFDNGEQMELETANDNQGFVAQDYILLAGTWGSPRMINEEGTIFITETNDDKVPLVMKKPILLEVAGDQLLLPVMTPSEENTVLFHWSGDQLPIPASTSFQEEPQEVVISVPVRQSYPFIMPSFPRFLSQWSRRTKKSSERQSNLPPIFII